MKPYYKKCWSRGGAVSSASRKKPTESNNNSNNFGLGHKDGNVTMSNNVTASTASGVGAVSGVGASNGGVGAVSGGSGPAADGMGMGSFSPEDGLRMLQAIFGPLQSMLLQQQQQSQPIAAPTASNEGAASMQQQQANKTAVPPNQQQQQQTNCGGMGGGVGRGGGGIGRGGGSVGRGGGSVGHGGGGRGGGNDWADDESDASISFVDEVQTSEERGPKEYDWQEVVAKKGLRKAVKGELDRLWHKCNRLDGRMQHVEDRQESLHFKTEELQQSIRQRSIIIGGKKAKSFVDYDEKEECVGLIKDYIKSEFEIEIQEGELVDVECCAQKTVLTFNTCIPGSSYTLLLANKKENSSDLFVAPCQTKKQQNIGKRARFAVQGGAIKRTWVKRGITMIMDNDNKVSPVYSTGRMKTLMNQEALRLERAAQPQKRPGNNPSRSSSRDNQREYSRDRSYHSPDRQWDSRQGSRGRYNKYNYRRY